MVRKTDYDLLVWRSFPSSARLYSDELTERPWWPELPTIPVQSGKILRTEVQVKGQNLSAVAPGGLFLQAYDGSMWKYFIGAVTNFPPGSYEWVTLIKEIPVPQGISAVKAYFSGGTGTKENPATTWVDDLKIYQDGVLIYDNYFTTLRPGKVVPVMTQPPEIIVRAWQRRKQKLEERLPTPPLAIASI